MADANVTVTSTVTANTATPTSAATPVSTKTTIETEFSKFETDVTTEENVVVAWFKKQSKTVQTLILVGGAVVLAYGIITLLF